MRIKVHKMINKLKHLIEQATEMSYESWDRLCEHADRASEIKQTIRHLAPNIIEHCYKIIAYSNDERYKTILHHWASEIAGGLVKFCNKLVKSSNKPLTTQQIVETIISKYKNAGELQDIVFECDQQYGTPTEQDYDIIYNKIVNKLPALVNHVKDNKRPNLEEIINILI